MALDFQPNSDPNHAQYSAANMPAPDGESALQPGATILRFPDGVVLGADDELAHEEARTNRRKLQDQLTSVMTSPDDIHQARKIVGMVYVDAKNGYVQPSDLTPEGYLNSSIDPHVAQSVYFGGRHKVNGPIIATGRLIRKDRLEDYPALKEFGVEPDTLPSWIDPSRSAEFSALAKVPHEATLEDTMHLYATILCWSLEHGIDDWFMSVDARLLKQLDGIFGRGTFQRIGEAREDYMGSPTIPVHFDTRGAVARWVPRLNPDSPEPSKMDAVRQHVNAIFRDHLRNVDTTNLDSDTATLIKCIDDDLSAQEERSGTNADNATNGYVIDNESNPALVTAAGSRSGNGSEGGGGIRSLLTGRNAIRLGLLALTILEGVGVAHSDLPAQGVNPWVYFAFNAGTIEPYIRGGAEALNGDNSRLRRFGGAAIFYASTIAPYAYIIWTTAQRSVQTANIESLEKGIGASTVILVGAFALNKARTVAGKAWRNLTHVKRSSAVADPV